MKRFTFFKTLLVAAGLLGGSSAWGVDTYTWDFTNTTTWTTAKISTGSAVTLNPSGETLGTGEYGVTFNFSNSLSLADGSTAGGQVKYNSGSKSVYGTGLWFAASGNSGVNRVSMTIPSGFKVTFNLLGGAPTRKWKYSTDGGTTSTDYTTSTALVYKNETEEEVTFVLWADNPYKNNNTTLQLQNGISSIVLEDLTTIPAHEWSVKAIIKNTSTEIDSWDGATLQEGEDYYVWGKKVIKYNEQYYELDDDKFTGNNMYFNTTMETADVVHEISYTLNEDIVAFEEIGTGTGKYSAGGYAWNSNKYAESVLDAGVYQVDIYVVSNGSGGSNHRHENLWVGGETVYTTDNTDGLITQRFIVSADKTTVYVQGAGSGNNGDNLDYVIIRKVSSDATVSSTVTSAGYATFSSIYPLNLDEISGGTAYVVTSAANGYIHLEEASGVVPANTGLILKAENGGTVTIPVSASAGTAPTTNYLVAVTADNTTVTAGNYVLAAEDDVAGFYLIGETTATLNAGKAYLSSDIPVSGRAKARLLFADDATAIKTIAVDAAENGAIYNVAGQRVNAAYKGIVIKNGKKYLNK